MALWVPKISSESSEARSMKSVSAAGLAAARGASSGSVLAQIHERLELVAERGFGEFFDLDFLAIGSIGSMPIGSTAPQLHRLGRRRCWFRFRRCRSGSFGWFLLLPGVRNGSLQQTSRLLRSFLLNLLRGEAQIVYLRENLRLSRVFLEEIAERVARILVESERDVLVHFGELG